MSFPKTRDELKTAGYRFENHGVCRGCKQEIEWFTTPKDKKMPFDLMPNGDSPAIAHWSTCPNAEDFRTTR